jgi:hypothetical protein
MIPCFAGFDDDFITYIDQWEKVCNGESPHSQEINKWPGKWSTSINSF